MSSAAVQPSAAAISSRQQYSTRDQYYPHQPSSSSRKNSTRQSNAASSPKSPADQLPSPVSATSSMTTPRALPTHSSANNSPAVSVPPRTSSHRSPAGSSPNDQHTSSRSHDADHTPAARRRNPQDSNGTPHRDTAEPMDLDLPHQDSTIIDRLVISDPAEDQARSEARRAESRPNASITVVPNDDGSARATTTRSRHEGGKRKEMKFGDYILGQTLGEGEFGKVKMGWKRDGSAQVAIKLIRKESLDSNPTRLPKIHREIAILKELDHPNIVRLHEMYETERHIGIILEYASGGELFDYILQHRYLKDNAARRLFAQLISGVGYLHKKGIVHRDLKLENLLLDRSRNIIITDFGFANTFNPDDELGEEAEFRLQDKEFVKRMCLDEVGNDGHRRGDLMQTSCGSPCYAAPELVVSDSLYTGRKVDVWSCGVILYAMLAGYLPFDDDPANPEGDNINLLYRYIVSTPLIFPDYVTPHARDLLKRILVPDPRKRADLFEIARHSWLSEFSHVVGFITSSTTTSNDITNTTVPSSSTNEVPSLARSASVREPTTKSHANRQTAIGALAEKSARIEQTPEAEKPKTSRDTKRRTVQVEYVAPQSPTRAEPQSGKTRARTGDVAPVEVASENYQRAAPAPSSYVSPPAPRPVREQQRAISDNVLQNASVSYAQRPSTGGSTSAAGGAPAVVARDQAQGRISQPPRAAPYPEAAQPDRRSYAPRDSSSADHSQIGFPQTVATGAMAAAPPPARLSRPPRGHRRSSTLSGLTERLGFGKRGSLFGSRSSGSEEVESGDGSAEKPKRGSRKNHPPVSMARPMPNDNAAAASGSGSVASGGAEPRKSTDSRRTSFSFSRRSNRDKDADAGAPPPSRSSRRFSLLPSFVRGGNKEDRDAAAAERPPSAKRSSAAPAVRDFRPRMAFGRGESRSPSRSTTDSAQDPIQPLYDSALDGPSPPPQPQQQQHSRSASLGQPRHYPPQQPPTSNPSSSAVPARKPVGSGNTPPGGSPPMHQQQQQPPRSSNNHLQPFQDPYASAPTPGPNGEALMQHNVFYPPPAAGSDRSGASDSAPVIGLAQLQAQQQQHHHHNQQQLLQREPATNFQQMLPESQLQQQLRDEEMLYQQQQQQQAAREKPGVLHKRRGFNEAFDNDGGHAGSSGAARRVMAMFNWKRRTRAGPTVA